MKTIEPGIFFVSYVVNLIKKDDEPYQKSRTGYSFFQLESTMSNEEFYDHLDNIVKEQHPDNDEFAFTAVNRIQ